jgi:hypothetical protein
VVRGSHQRCALPVTCSVRNGDGTVSVLDLTHDTVLRTVTVSAPAAHPVEGLVTNENASAQRLFVPIS